MTADDVCRRANESGISSQAAFLDWAKSRGIECTDYDVDGIMLFGGPDDGAVLRFDGKAWGTTHL